jgi:hypothetical protein
LSRVVNHRQTKQSLGTGRLEGGGQRQRKGRNSILQLNNGEPTLELHVHEDRMRPERREVKDRGEWYIAGLI